MYAMFLTAVKTQNKSVYQFAITITHFM
jgi:hypothetical protein